MYSVPLADANHCTKQQFDHTNCFATTHPHDQPTNVSYSVRRSRMLHTRKSEH